MLDVAGDLEPFVLAFSPHRDGRGDEIGIVERAERNGDGAGNAVVRIIYGAAAVGAEMKVRRAIVAGGGVGPGLAGGGHLGGGETDLRGERAAAALLAIEAMADGDADRGAGRGGTKLPAAAGGGVGGHCGGPSTAGSSAACPIW